MHFIFVMMFVAFTSQVFAEVKNQYWYGDENKETVHPNNCVNAKQKGIEFEEDGKTYYYFNGRVYLFEHYLNKFFNSIQLSCYNLSPKDF